MRTKTVSKAKFIVKVRSNKGTNELYTMSLYDNRNQKYLTEEYIKERNIEKFLNIADLKETLNWNLNGDSSKYQFKWGQSGKFDSEGIAYIFD